ncbi:MAG: hypothetical protein R3B47_16700 [Bacteroidia bacterium]
MKRLIRLLLLGQLAGMAASWKLWFGNRLFPNLTFSEEFSDVRLTQSAHPRGDFSHSAPGRYSLSKRTTLADFLLGIALFIVLDQMRLQPWVYMYFFLLLPFVFVKRESPETIWLPCLQIIMVAMYLWSGFHKFNPNFIETTFSNMLSQLMAIGNPRPFCRWAT